MSRFKKIISKRNDRLDRIRLIEPNEIFLAIVKLVFAFDVPFPNQTPFENLESVSGCSKRYAGTAL